MSEALQLADALERDYHDETLAPRMAAAELRRLVAENEALRGELAEQARLVGMGSEREARLMAENERLTGCLKTANDQAEHFERGWYLRGDLNAELVEACRTLVDLPGTVDWKETLWLAVQQARAALARVEASK